MLPDDDLDPATCRALGFRPDGIADLSRLGLSPRSVAERANFIGGSDATIIGQGMLAGGDPSAVNKLAEIKRGIRPPLDLSKEIHVQLGNFTEPFILAWAERVLGLRCTRNRERVYHPRHPFMACTLDGWVDDWKGGSRVIQAKHSNAFKKPPELVETYRWQIQHEIACTGADGALLVMMLGTMRFAWVEIEPDYDLWGRLSEAEHRFWHARMNGYAPVAPKGRPRAAPSIPTTRTEYF